MARAAALFVTMLALTLSGAGTMAHAQSKKTTPRPVNELTVPMPSRLAQDNLKTDSALSKRSLQWNADGRWSLKLDMNPLRQGGSDVEAGAYYRLSPSVRVGGTIGGTDTREKDKTIQRARPEERNEPRVRLETTFRF